MKDLIKYEFKNNKKPILQIITIAVIASTILQILFKSLIAGSIEEKNLLFGSQLIGIFFSLLMFGAGLVLMGAGLVYYFRVADILKKDIYEDIGYLNFALPRSGYQIIGAKYIVAAFWTLIMPIILIVFNGLLAFILFVVFGDGGLSTLLSSFSWERFNEMFAKIPVLPVVSWITNQLSSVFLQVATVFAALIFDYNVGSKKNGSIVWAIYAVVFSIIYSTLLGYIAPIDSIFGINSGSVNSIGAEIKYIQFLSNEFMVRMFIQSTLNFATTGLLILYAAHNYENKVEKF